MEVTTSTPDLNASSSGNVHQAFMMLWDGIVASPCLGPISCNQFNVVESPLAKGLATIKQVQIPKNMFMFIFMLAVWKGNMWWWCITKNINMNKRVQRKQHCCMVATVSFWENCKFSILKHIGQLDVECLVQFETSMIQNSTNAFLFLMVCSTIKNIHWKQARTCNQH